jgi:hypothetical protein
MGRTRVGLWVYPRFTSNKRPDDQEHRISGVLSHFPLLFIFYFYSLVRMFLKMALLTPRMGRDDPLDLLRNVHSGKARAGQFETCTGGASQGAGF